MKNSIFSFPLCKVFCSVILLAITINLSSKTYYVSTTGNNTTNNGLSVASPWAPIDTAASLADAGDTVFVAAGTYYEQVTVDSTGTPGNYICFIADTLGTIIGSGGDVTIDGLSTENYGFYIDGKSYILIDGFTFRFQVVSGLSIRVQASASDASYNIVQNCSFSDWNTGGSPTNAALSIARFTNAGQTSYNLIRDNTFTSLGNAIIGILIYGASPASP